MKNTVTLEVLVERVLDTVCKLQGVYGANGGHTVSAVMHVMDNADMRYVKRCTGSVSKVDIHIVREALDMLVGRGLLTRKCARDGSYTGAKWAPVQAAKGVA